MADERRPGQAEAIIVTDVGAHEPGMVSIHDERTGQTIQADQEMYLLAIKNDLIK